MLDNLKSQQFLPLYYGWFLTQKDSSNLFELGIKCLMEGVVAMGENLAEDINAAGQFNLIITCLILTCLIISWFLVQHSHANC